MIEITHSADEGTVARGVAKHDPPTDVLKAAGWRWSGRLYAWHLPESQGEAVDLRRIEATVAELRQAGLEVSVQIDDEPAPLPAQYSVKWVRRRVERLEADLRKVHRQLDQHFRRVEAGVETTATADVWAIQMLVRRIDMTEELRRWHEVIEELTDGTHTHTPETVQKGDYVRIAGHWRKVARVNQKSVTVETDHSGTGRAAYYDITGHRPADGLDEPLP